ncbi:F0F1 ATP synthase subunit A [Tepidimicrobium xylanilyticum]|uniref:ATP synthase subunit a n=1 Tax=Tepidimicrobium xylanilyticum TaxID=1123352 RepID=A0A1H2R1U7_9FIRM|nr:F0F1 ATP synthase subunit A [Tepidimicrobium xylanilyticum]SDW12649.1 F-type H+-transporting ATPase subunit a [Tepidimicrobium xylanilyticum]
MKIEFTLNVFGKSIFIPDTVVNVYLVVIILLILAAIVNKKVKQASPDEKPSNFLNVIELAVEAVENLVKQTMGAKHVRFASYIFTLMAFLLFANLFGLLGFTPPTSNYSVTLTLALITFILTQYYGLKTNGLLGYLKGFTEPMAFLTPLNIIGELANPISLSFRLFGNILSGVIIMGLLYQALGYIAPIITPPLHAYFDLFSGILQTFIFSMLTMIFIGGNLD